MMKICDKYWIGLTQKWTSNSDWSDYEENPIFQNINDFLWENNSTDYETTLLPLLTNSGICDIILE